MPLFGSEKDYLVKVIFGIDDVKYKAGLKGVAGATTEAEQKVIKASKSFDMLAGAVGGFMALSAVQGAIRWLSDTARLASEAEEANVRLSNSLTASGRNAKLLEKDLVDFAEALRFVVKVDDEAAKSMTSLAVTLTKLDNENIKKLVLSAIGLAKVMGTDAPAAMKLMIRAGEGITNSIRGTTIVLKDGGTQAERYAELFRQTAPMVEVASGELKTYAGRTWALNEAWRELRETMGKGMIQNQAMVMWIEGVTAAIDSLNVSLSTASWNFGDALNKMPDAFKIMYAITKGMMIPFSSIKYGMQTGRAQDNAAMAKGVSGGGYGLTDWESGLLADIRTPPKGAPKTGGGGGGGRGGAGIKGTEGKDWTDFISGLFDLEHANVSLEDLMIDEYFGSISDSVKDWAMASREVNKELQRMYDYLEKLSENQPYWNAFMPSAGNFQVNKYKLNPLDPNSPDYDPFQDPYGDINNGTESDYSSNYRLNHGGEGPTTLQKGFKTLGRNENMWGMAASAYSGYQQGGFGGAASALLPVIGSAFGPVGSIIGGVVGSLVGGLFGKKKQGDTKTKPIYAEITNFGEFWKLGTTLPSSFVLSGRANTKQVDPQGRGLDRLVTGHETGQHWTQ